MTDGKITLTIELDGAGAQTLACPDDEYVVRGDGRTRVIALDGTTVKARMVDIDVDGGAAHIELKSEGGAWFELTIPLAGGEVRLDADEVSAKAAGLENRPYADFDPKTDADGELALIGG